MRRSIFKPLLFLFLAAGCAPLVFAASEASAAIDANQQALEYSQVGEFLYGALPFLANKRYTQIKAMQGLQGESCVAEPSYIRGQFQQRCTLFFEGLEISGVVYKGHLALNHAVITSRKWQLKWQLNVGTRVVNLKAKFKQIPEQPSPDVLYYGDETSSVRFFIKNELIARVELNIYDG